MAEKINKREEILNRLKSEQKSEILNKPEDIEIIQRMNDELERDRRDFQRKENESLINASQVILNA